MQIIPNKLEDTQLTRKLSDTDAIGVEIFKSVSNMWSRKQQALCWRKPKQEGYEMCSDSKVLIKMTKDALGLIWNPNIMTIKDVQTVRRVTAQRHCHNITISTVL